jgi:hypothetical protein
MTGFAALLSLIFSNSRISPGKTSIMERFMSQLDKTDRRILTILQMDGRIAAVERADRIGLSPTEAGWLLQRA